MTMHSERWRFFLVAISLATCIQGWAVEPVGPASQAVLKKLIEREQGEPTA